MCLAHEFWKQFLENCSPKFTLENRFFRILSILTQTHGKRSLGLKETDSNVDSKGLTLGDVLFIYLFLVLVFKVIIH